MMKHYVKLACFVGGTLFGSAGVKLLASKDAKKAYRWETPILEIIFRFMAGWTPRAMCCSCRAR